jgi:hypothetical protein
MADLAEQLGMAAENPAFAGVVESRFSLERLKHAFQTLTKLAEDHGLRTLPSPLEEKINIYAYKVAELADILSEGIPATAAVESQE